MNKTYRLIWNALTNTWIAVAETVRSRGKRASGALLLAAAGLVAVSPAPTLAAPPTPPAATPSLAVPLPTPPPVPRV